MTAAESPKRRRKRWWAFAAGGVLVGSGAAIALGPAAHLIIDGFGDGARVWRLGRIQIDDVSGPWLGALRAGSVTIADEEGVWFEAHDVALDWSPQDMLFGAVKIDTARASTVTVSRRPRLLDRRPSSGAMIDVDIGALRIDEITIAESVVGAAGQFTTELSLNLHDEKLQQLELSVERLDSDSDRLTAVYRGGDGYALNVDLLSAPGGIIARSFGLSESGVRATALGDGDVGAGEARFEAAAGETSLLNGQTRWREGAWGAEGQADLAALPALATLAARIGDSIAFTANGDAERAIRVHAETPFMALDAEGALNEDLELDGPARFVATTSRLSAIARESPFELGAARLEGELRRARGTTAIRATLDAQNIVALGRETRLSGPIEAALSRERFTASGDLRAPQQTAPLFAGARLQTELEYDRDRGRFELSRADLNGDALAINASGWSNGADGAFSGEWRVRRLETLAIDLGGEAAGRWRAFRENAEIDSRAWAIAADGAGARVTGAPPIIPQLLGPTPRLDARMRYENGGITVSHARLDGERLRAGATGRIVRGQANLTLEASARGPLNVGGAEISGAVDATGRVTGSIGRPSIAMRGALASFVAGGVAVDQPIVDFTLSPRGNAYVGRAGIRGASNGQPLAASSDIALNGAVITLSQLDATWGGMEAQGTARVAENGLSAELDVRGTLDGLVAGVAGRFTGDVSLTPNAVTLDAQVADARAGDLHVRAATLHAQGPLDAIATTFDMRGRVRDAPLSFAGVATLNTKQSNARIEGRGTLADAPIFTRAPITANWGRGAVRASLDLAVDDGVVRAHWQERGRAVSGSAEIDDAPLAPIAAVWGERATGRIDGRISLASEGRGLTGDADLRLDDARVSGRQRGTLDLRILGNLSASRLTTTIDATSQSGLVAHFEADAPVTTSAAPIRIALVRERRGRASWSVRGPAEALWAAARLPDQSLQGTLDGDGVLEFGAGYLSGDGHIEIVDGQFEDKLTGVRLVDLDARLRLDDRGVTIENFTAAGARGGTLRATGGSASERAGEISVVVNDIRVADRPDARAVASGELTLSWEGLASSLRGDLNINEASIDVAASPQAGIPTLDVIEINRPGADDAPEATPPLRPSATTLNVNVRAPGRVFTRGRGVDAEWSLDLRLTGASNNPRVFGEARAIRGTLALSGQPFEIENAVIYFRGDPLDATINLAAVRDTADLSARIRLTGTARDPEITFSSDPALPEDEILPQILFGRSVEDLSGLEAAQLAASLAALSGRASLDIVDAARAAAGLDRFNVRQDEDGGFLVAGGVYLTRDVYVEVARTGLGQAQTRLEWTIRPRLVLVTSFLGNGDQRVSLRWRRETD